MENKKAVREPVAFMVRRSDDGHIFGVYSTNADAKVTAGWTDGEIVPLYLAAPTQVSAAQEMRAVPDLHNAIMSLPGNPESVAGDALRVAYLMGHRDARHAAAELAIGYVPEASTPTAPAAMDEKGDAK